MWQDTRLSVDITRFDKAALDLKEILSNWYNNTLESQLQSLSATAANNYYLWKFTKNYDRSQIANPLLKSNSGWARTSQDKADTFANYLSNVFRPNEAKDRL
ncbi:unnamed protein product [Arctia plantaginis]|uniref:Uncharacterized protein n=1 Tax=Arctia plantaginis TaxID=874455 RepID=A0A8S1B8H0_ARCPL|nr:unnamed protein product [Arctia plantaginis]